MIGHMVYFSLKDNTPASKKKLVDACRKYLRGHPGTVYFAAGTLADIGAGIVSSLFAVVTILVLSMFLVSRGRGWIDALVDRRPKPDQPLPTPEPEPDPPPRPTPAF